MLLVSDFDETFYRGTIQNLQLNCNKVRSFIQQGNFFMLVSGANVDFLKQYTDEHDIPYDFLAGRNGIVSKVTAKEDINRHYPPLKLSRPLEKDEAVERIVEWFEIEDSDVFTIGDSETDLVMIARWNGFQVGDSSSLLKVSLGKYNEVYELVDDICKKKVKKREEF